MTDSFMKRRGGGFGGKHFADQAKKRTAAEKNGGRKGKIPDGKFDRWAPNTKKSVWINISPYQEYTYEVYNKDEKEVVEVTTTWYEYVSHFVPKGNTSHQRYQTSFVCSAGPRLDRPCYGDAIRKRHFEWLDRMEEEKGFRPKDEAPVSRSNRFALGITIMEKVYSIPVMNKDGSPRKSKAGKLIYNHIPASLVGDTDGIEYSSKFGHRAHWSMGLRHLEQLKTWDEKLRNCCGNCAHELMSTAVVCPDCETVQNLPSGVAGEDFMELREARLRCTACGYEGVMVPEIMCTNDCGKPMEGRLTGFDLRIKKVMTDENNSLLELAGIRMPKIIDESVEEMIKNPLNLAEIFTPEPIEFQKKLLRKELIEGLSPREGTFAESYNDQGQDDSDEGEIPFSL